MGRYTRKMRGVVGEITVVEMAEVNSSVAGDALETTTRSVASEEETSSSSPVQEMTTKKRTRTTSAEDNGELRSDSERYYAHELRSTRRRTLIAPPGGVRGAVSSVNESNWSDPEQPVSCCSSGASGEVTDEPLGAAVDPTVDYRGGVEVETLKFSDARSVRGRRFESRIREESEDLENSASRKRVTEAESGVERPTMPTESEIEDFFAAAEKDLHKRFRDKYNFDVVKDVPLEGRYEWIPVKPRMETI